MTGWYRYCAYGRLFAAFALGWQWCGPLPGNHGRYAGLVYWPHNGGPVWFEGAGS